MGAFNCFIGVDVGKNGGFASIVEEPWGEMLVSVFPWEDGDFKEHMRIMKIQHGSEIGELSIAFVEKVSAMPKQGVTSMFNFGKSAGYIEGVLAAIGIPYQLVPPQKWKKEFSLGSDKKQSIAVCERLFPSVSLYRTERCTTKHDGMAEALLIAEYARRIMSHSGTL
jgi:crossover junction endodeoxyribonuclease RuvC